MQRELDDLASRLGHSVSLDGPDGTVLAHSAQGPDVDPARVAAILTRQVPDAVLAYQRSHGVDRATGPVRVPANPGLGMTARTCLPLWRDGRLVGLLWVLDAEATLDAGALPILRAAGRRIATLLPSPAGPDLTGLLGRLLAGEPGRDVVDLLEELAPRSGSETLQLAAVAPARTDDGERLPARRGTAPRIRSTRGVLGSAWADGHQLVLLGAPRPVDDVGELVRRIVDASSAEQLVVGHSDPFRLAGTERPGAAPRVDPARLARLAARAVVAADCAAVDGALPATIGWEGLGAYRWLLRHTSSDSWPVPGPIPDGDRSGPMLRRTLEAYLDRAGDAAATTEALGVHRTTFYYRLERLTAVHGLRLDDGLARTDLHLALKTRRLALARDAFGWTDRFLGHLG